MIQGYVSLNGLGETGDLDFRDLTPSEEFRLLSLLERTTQGPISTTWIPCPDGFLVIPRQPERQYADNLVQWVLERRATVRQAASLAKGGELTWHSALKFLLYYPSKVTSKGDKSVRGVSVYLPRAPFSGNLAQISAVCLMKVPNQIDTCSPAIEWRVFPETKTDFVNELWNKVGNLANPLADKVRKISNKELTFHPSQVVFRDSRLWIDPLRRTQEYNILSLTILEQGTRPISGLIGSSRQMNEELARKMKEDIITESAYEELIQNLKIVDTRKRETVW